MSDLEIELVKYSKKTWTKSAVLGFFIGLAVIVPGISGSTVAIIFKLYRQFLYAIGHLFDQFKKCFVFLLPIGIGMVVGVGTGFIAVKALLEILPFAVICLFAGLMTGAFPAVKDEIKGVQMTPARIALLCVGVAIPVAIVNMLLNLPSLFILRYNSYKLEVLRKSVLKKQARKQQAQSRALEEAATSEA